MPRYSIYTDGSSKGNGKTTSKCGWGFVVFVDGDANATYDKACGPLEAGSTNNQGEITAVYKALQWLVANNQVAATVYADSEYTIKCLTTWFAAWKSNGWKKADGNTPANLELLKEVVEYAEKHGMKLKHRNKADDSTVNFVHVKGHTGNKDGNHMADLMANKGADGETIIPTHPNGNAVLITGKTRDAMLQLKKTLSKFVNEIDEFLLSATVE